MGKGMSEDQIYDFVSYFMDSIDPEVYYDNLYKNNPKNLAAQFTIDDTHRIVGFKTFK